MQDSGPEITIPTKVWWYTVLWVFYIYLFISILQFSAEDNQNLFLAGMYLIGFGVHEISHIVMVFLPPILTALAGSVGEISFTLLIIFAALKEKAYYAAVFGLLWFMLAMNSVGRYIADARSQTLPLVGPGETVTHDWYFILSEWDMLSLDVMLGNTVRIAGDIVGLFALCWGLWLIVSLVRVHKDDKYFG